MPLHKDEQFDDGADTRASRRDRVRGIGSQDGDKPAPLRQARHLPRTEDDPYQDFYSDEHPEIPTIRRASRYLDSCPSSSDHPATRADGIANEHTRRFSRSQSHEMVGEDQKQYFKPMNQVARSPRPRRQVDTSLSSPQPATTRGRGLRKPLPRHYRRETLWPFLPQFVQRQNWLKTGGGALGVLLALIVMSSLLHSVFSQVPAIIIIPGGTNDNTDPHALVITPPTTDHPTPPVYAQAAYLLNADTVTAFSEHSSALKIPVMSKQELMSGAGATLYAYNPFTHLPIMSTTKLMTALLAVEHGNLDQTVTINGQIANDISQLPPDSSNINLKSGESYTLHQLMYGLLLASGNDAAIAIADTIGGSYANFVTMMNQKAAELGLHDTHFQNPHGLQDPNHYSCAHDLAMLGLNSLSDPTIRQISGTLKYHIDQAPEHAAHDFFNGNQFIWWYPGVDAGKPGYDAATNFVQVISCIRNGHHLIGVTIHTINWWTDMRDLMNWGFNTYTWVSPHDLNTPDHPIPYADLWNGFASDTKESTIPTADHGRYYIYTGYSITGDIESYFDKNGGLTTFGFPLSQPTTATQNTLRQRFEHGTIQCNTQNKQCQKGI